MTGFLHFIAKPGFEDHINAAYAKLVGKAAEYLVYSQRVIEAEIKFIHSEEGRDSFSHVRASLHTVEDWNRIFPDYALGSGFLRVNPRGNNNSEEVRRVAKFLVLHRQWFDKVTGLDEVCSAVPAKRHTKAA